MAEMGEMDKYDLVLLSVFLCVIGRGICLEEPLKYTTDARYACLLVCVFVFIVGITKKAAVNCWM